MGGGVGWMTQGLDGGPWTTGPLVPGLAGSGTTLGAGVALAALCGFLGPCERLGGGAGPLDGDHMARGWIAR